MHVTTLIQLSGADIKPAYCNEAQFRSMLTEFEWENRVNVTTTITYAIFILLSHHVFKLTGSFVIV